MNLINENDVEYEMDGLAADFFNNLKVCSLKNLKIEFEFGSIHFSLPFIELFLFHRKY